MSVLDAADAREPGSDFQFIAQVSDIFSSSAKSLAETNEKVSLIASAGKYGLIFVSDLEYVKVFRIASLIDGNNDVPIITFKGKGIITHLSTSCDSQTLFICEIVNESPFSFFYDIFSIVSCTSHPTPFYATPLCTLPGSRLASLAWNPCDPCCLVAAISNGDLALIRMKEKSMEFSSAKGIKANALTWSSKGKQLAVGKHDGTISLFKPDLTHVRDIERPQSQEIGSVLNITWFTNTEFFIGYSINNNSAPVLFYANAPKGKLPTFYNFEDVCYSSEREKQISYYSYFISEWNLLFVLSSNGIEMGVVGKSETNNANECQWCQWFPDDGARASMNFVNVVQETYPLGLAIDFTSSMTFISKDEQTKGPFPVLMSLSTGGELNIFFVENKLTEFQNLCISPESIPSHGFRTPEQYGQSSCIPSPIEHKPSPVLQLNRNTPSAFSFVPKGDTKISQSQTFSFSTPIKPLTSTVSLPALSASPVTSSSVSSAEPLNPVNPPFASPFVPKPVSLSSEVGVSSNCSKTLHIPSPKKSFGSALSSISVPATVVSSPTPNVTSHLKPSLAPFKEIVPEVMVPPPPKASKQQVMQLIKGELNNFEMEMLDNCNKNSSLQYKVGEKEDEQKINAALCEIKKWMSEMKKATHAVDEEVSQLHKNTFDALASYEDASSYCEVKMKSKNQMHMQFRPLDPYSQRRINEIRTRYYYLVSQITEVDSKLDSLWEEYNASKKSSSTRTLKQSTSDNLYRSISNLHNSRVCFEKQLDQICLQLKKLYNNQIELSYLTNNLSLNDTNFAEKGSPLPTIILPNSGKKMASSKKNANLQKILSERNVAPIRKQYIPDTSKKYVVSKSLETALPATTFGEKISTAKKSQSTTLLSLLENNPLSNAKYEDISPPVSPEKASKSSNPLAALSSLVGMVPQPKEKKLSGFSFREEATAIFDASSAADDFSKSKSGTSAPSTSNRSIKTLIPEITKTTCSGLFSVSSLPANSSSPLGSMFKTNLSNASTDTVSSKLTFAPNLQGSEVRFNSSTSSSALGVSTTATSSLFPAMFKNLSSNFSVSSKNEEEIKSTKGVDISSSFGSTAGGLFTSDKIPTSSYVESPTVSVKPMFNISDSANISSSKLDKDSISSSIFEMPPTASSPSMFKQPLMTSVSSSFEQQVPSIDKNNSAPVISTLSQLLQSQESNSSIASEGVSPSGSSVISTLSNSASSPFGVPISNSSSSILGLLTLNKSLAASSYPSSSISSTSFGQSPSITSSVFGSSPSTLFSQPSVALPSVPRPIVSSEESSASKISSSGPLFSQVSSSSSLFQQTSMFGQKTSPFSSTPIFGGISNSITTKITKDDSTNDQAKSLVDAVVKEVVLSEQSYDSPSSPLFGLPPTTSSEHSVIPNFSSLLKPSVNASSVFGNTSSASSVFSIPVAPSNNYGQDPPLYTSTSVSTIPSSVNSSSSIFGTPSTSVASLFDGNNLKSPTNASIFGGATKSPSIFGNAGNNASNPALSSSSTSNAFGSTSVFGQSLPTVSVAPSIFESSTNTGSIFGAKTESNSSIFGSLSQNSTSVFGANSPSSTVTVTSSQQSVFSSGFGQQASSASVFGGGSMFSGLGKVPSEENASKNVFGNLSGSSSSVPQTNLFGGSGGSSGSFGSLSNTTSSNATGGAFSPVKTGGSIFGGAPTFGGSPSFATDLSKPRTNVFGGTPSFGSPLPSAFGGTSPPPSSSIFGGNSAFGGGSTFGSSSSNPAPASSTFGGAPTFNAGSPGSGFSSFANAGGATFGSLAGNQSSSNSNVPSFGGSSFSGWR